MATTFSETQKHIRKNFNIDKLIFGKSIWRNFNERAILFLCGVSLLQ